MPWIGALAMAVMGACSDGGGPREEERAEPLGVTTGEERAASKVPAPIEENSTDALLRAGPLDGREVWLGADGVLHVGELTTPIERFFGPEAHAPTDWLQADLRVVPFAEDRDAVLLTLPTLADEDPPNRYRLFLVTGGELVMIFDRVVGTYGVQPVEVPGDGTVRYVEDGWAACDRTDHPPEATRQEVVHRWDPTHGRMIERRRDTAQTQRCDQLSACPFVYLVENGEVRFVGEILRNLRGREQAALQPLELGLVRSRTVRLLLREEKKEVTFLDELYAEIDGVRVDPRSCHEERPSFCDADGQPLVMRQGDEVGIELQLPPGAGEVTLWARGYYVPTPTAGRR